MNATQKKAATMLVLTAGGLGALVFGIAWLSPRESRERPLMGGVPREFARANEKGNGPQPVAQPGHLREKDPQREAELAVARQKRRLQLQPEEKEFMAALTDPCAISATL